MIVNCLYNNDNWLMNQIEPHIAYTSYSSLLQRQIVSKNELEWILSSKRLDGPSTTVKYGGF